MLKMEG